MDYIKFEIELEDKLQHPHLFAVDGVGAKKKIALQVYSVVQETDLLLIDPLGFSNDAILAGITEKQIEYLAKNAPQVYKENIVGALKNKETAAGIFSLAKALDEDLDRNSQQNQLRVQHVIQYIKDNLPAFQF